MNELAELFKECEKYAEISKVKTGDDEQVYSFDMVTSDGDIIKPQTYKLREKDIAASDQMEDQIENILKGNSDVAIVTLLRILNKRCGK